jgi:hypothetical protein
MSCRSMVLFASCALLWTSGANAQVNCGNQPSEVPPDVAQRIQGDVEGKAQAFTKLLGDVNLKGKVDTSRNEVHQKYNDLDKTVIDRYMIWVSCQSILQDKDLKPPERNKLWLEIYRELRKPSEEKKSRIPEDLFNKIEIGRAGSTAITYLESILGVPKSRSDISATFAVDGYEIAATYLRKSNANGSQGTIIRLGATIKDEVTARRAPIILNGYWNATGCSYPAGREVCREDILPLNLSGFHKLSDFIDDDSCYPEQEGGPINNTNPSYFCVRHAYGSSNFIERRFDLSTENDSKLWAAFSLLNVLNDPSVYALDQNVIRNYENMIGLKQSDANKRRDELVNFIQKDYSSRKVVGFAISVENWTEYQD